MGPKIASDMNILNMKFANNIVLKLFWIFLIATTVEAATTQNVSELIEQAHKHDNMYTLGPEASQQKAVSLYEKALAAEPDEQQRLHILYRMAQLYGSSYQLEKGEKPDFPKAISIYKKIVESYTPQEPLVYKAMSSLCDHYTTLRQFKTALKWSKKILEYDTDQIDKQIGDLERKKQLLYMHDQPQADSLTRKERREIIEQVKQQPSLEK
ncbi:MAG: tetratricopeptide repeat protein, partial [Planctomycetota bacterium]